MKSGLIPLLPLMLVALAGCPRQTKLPDGPAELVRFTSATQLKQYLKDQYQVATRGGYRGGLLDVILTGGAAAAPPSSGAAPESNGAPDSSSTNLQEEGVDESDTVKTDGTYIYVLANRKLSIVRAVPAPDMEVVGRLDLDLPGTELYLNAGRAVVLARPDSAYGYDLPVSAGDGAPGSAAAPGDGQGAGGTQNPWDGNWNTFDIYLVDVSRPDAPALTRKYSFQGQLITSRMVGAKLYLVSQVWPTVPTVNRIAQADIEGILPKYRVVAGEQQSVEPMLAASDVYHPANPDGYSLVNITTLDTVQPDNAPVTTGMMAGYGMIYASTSGLYISSPNYNPYGEARENTDIHKFDLTGDAAEYVASGRIPGHLLNQFSMGEKDGFLRVATTESQVMAASMGFAGPLGRPGAIFSGIVPATQNHVFVLEQVGDRLQVAGHIGGIAPGEQLYAARFVGDRGFLVTFQKIDPLFTVDLADPRNPRIVGELKVPGYSEYIHLLDENHLLTIGKDAQEESGFAWYLGVKLSIFDVTDMANPSLLHSATIGVRGTDSEALRNHKAFTYHNGMLAFPIDLYEGKANPPSYGNYTFGGLMVYRVGVDQGFEALGRISTINQSQPYYWSYNQWTRGVFIGNTVYAACERAIKAASTADMSHLESTVNLP